MKRTFIILAAWLLVTGEAWGEPYPGTTAAEWNDNPNLSLSRINRILHESRSGTTPLAITNSGSSITRGAPTDRSGTITTGGTSQTLAAALSSRTYIEIQNISDETMYVNFGAAATSDSNSFRILAGGSYVNPSHYCLNGTITIIGATTGKKFVAKEG